MMGSAGLSEGPFSTQTAEEEQTPVLLRWTSPRDRSGSGDEVAIGKPRHDQ